MKLASVFSSSEAASRGAPERTHEIVQFLKGERLFEDRRCSDEGDVLVGILLMEVVDKFGAAGAGTAQEFQGDENHVVGSLVAVNAERFVAVWRQSNFVTELVEHNAGSLQDGIFCFDHQNLHGSPLGHAVRWVNTSVP